MVVSDGDVLNRKLKLIASPMDNLLKDSPQYWRILANGSLAISFILMLSIVFTQYSNIRERERRQKHQACLISKLEKALGKVRMLSGLLPICASCKKIKDDKGYWKKIETYISEHSEAEFSHSICEECSDKLYGDEKWYKKKKNLRKIN